MITITQNKVAGFDPRWAPFTGFSVLFDNPGDSLTADRGLSKVTCAAASGGPLDLYFGLEKALAELDRDLLIRAYLFCPLPSSSYHVTVWDGINVDNISVVNPVVRPTWSAFLDALPRSLDSPPTSMQVITDSALSRWSGSISFQFDKLTIWGNQVLVARLRPKGNVSEALEDLSAQRRDLSEAAEHEFGVPFSRSYSPHISLGYFANQEHGQLAHARLEHWTEQFQVTLQAAVITYASLDVYGFTDMATFWKATR